MESIEIKQANILETSARFGQSLFFVRKLGPKTRLRKSLCLSAGQFSSYNFEPDDLIPKVVKKTVGENVFRFQARRHFRKLHRR